MKATLCAALLAGGKSTRMGRDKALIEWEGQPLWERQMQTLLALGPDEIIISGRSDGPWANKGHRVVQDRILASGPIAGLAAVLAATSCQFVLAIAVDMPNLTPAYLEQLVSSCMDGRGVVPQIGGSYEPMAAIYPKASSTIAESLLNDNVLSLQNFVDCCISAGLLVPVAVDASTEKVFRNVNTPADLSMDAKRAFNG